MNKKVIIGLIIFIVVIAIATFVTIKLLNTSDIKESQTQPSRDNSIVNNVDKNKENSSMNAFNELDSNLVNLEKDMNQMDDVTGLELIIPEEK